jgi:hypothetical protein
MAARFILLYAPEVLVHLQSIDSKWHGLIRRTLSAQLGSEPLAPTANRKPLRQPAAFADAWELRFGPKNVLRAFYRVDIEERAVRVLAIGQKVGNELTIGKERFEL